MKNSIPPELMKSGDLDDIILSESCITSSSSDGIPIPSYTTTSYDEDDEEEQEYLL